MKHLFTPFSPTLKSLDLQQRDVFGNAGCVAQILVTAVCRAELRMLQKHV